MGRSSAKRRRVVLFVVIGLGTVAKSSSPDLEAREREIERDFNLHEAVSSSGNYSAGLVRERATQKKARAWEDLLVEEEEEKKRANNAAGLRRRERKRGGTDVISSSWKSSLKPSSSPRTRGLLYRILFRSRRRLMFL